MEVRQNAYGSIENDYEASEPEVAVLTGTKRGFLYKIPARYVLTLVGFLSFVSMAAQRLNIGMAVVAMVNASAMIKNVSDECSMDKPQNISHKEGEFTWSPELQGAVLAGLNYGFIVTQIPGGRLAERFGAKWVFASGMLCSSVFTLLTPVMARWHVGALIAAQVLKGLGQGLLFPCMSSLIGKWVPKMQRSFQLSLIFSGLHMGAFLTIVISGDLSESSFLGGWPSIFYLPGIVGVIAFLLWAVFIFESPEDHRRISNTELQFLLQSLEAENRNRKKTPIPWKTLLSSIPVWALVVGHFGQYWLLSFFTIVHPTYMGIILHFDIKQNGEFSSIPYLLKGIFAWLSSYFADWIRKREYLRANSIRKISNSISALGSSLCIMGFCLAGCDRTLNVVFFVMAYVLTAFMYPGTMITPVDMSPQYAGSIAGLMNGFGTLSGVIVPAVVGALTEKEQSLHQWNLMFYISIGISVFTALVFIIFGSAKPQNWQTDKTEEINSSQDTSVQR